MRIKIQSEIFIGKSVLNNRLCSQLGTAGKFSEIMSDLIYLDV